LSPPDSEPPPPFSPTDRWHCLFHTPNKLHAVFRTFFLFFPPQSMTLLLPPFQYLDSPQEEHILFSNSGLTRVFIAFVVFASPPRRNGPLVSYHLPSGDLSVRAVVSMRQPANPAVSPQAFFFPPATRDLFLSSPVFPSSLINRGDFFLEHRSPTLGCQCSNGSPRNPNYCRTGPVSFRILYSSERAASLWSKSLFCVWNNRRQDLFHPQSIPLFVRRLSGIPLRISLALLPPYYFLKIQFRAISYVE